MDSAENFRGLKISKDFFMSEKVDYLLRQDHGSDYLVMWEQLLLLAIDNDYTFELDKLKDSLKYYSSNRITQGLKHFEFLGLITIEDHKIYLLAGDGKTKLSHSGFFADLAKIYKGE